MFEVKTRPMVPFILNGRVWRFHFAPWKNGECLDQVCVEIPMKYYPNNDKTWVARQVFVTFVKRVVEYGMSIASQAPKNATKGPVVLATPEERTETEEIVYICNTRKMYYDKDRLPAVCSF